MSEINRSKISKQILKVLASKGLMKDINIFRDDEDFFGEKKEPLFVTKIKGYYHTGSSSLNLSITEGASKILNAEEKLLVVYNEDSLKIKKNDCLELYGRKYQIIDMGNVENIIFDMTIKV